MKNKKGKLLLKSHKIRHCQQVTFVDDYIYQKTCIGDINQKVLWCYPWW